MIAPRTDAVPHTHDLATRKALKACHVCQNATLHNLRCTGAETCGATAYHTPTMEQKRAAK